MREPQPHLERLQLDQGRSHAALELHTGHTLFFTLMPSLPILLPVPVTVVVLIYVTNPVMVRHLLV